VLNELKSSKPKIELGPRPGPKIRSGVRVPAALLSASSSQEGLNVTEADPLPSALLPVDSPHVDSDDDLEIV
jgi:hypothetical protein